MSVSAGQVMGASGRVASLCTPDIPFGNKNEENCFKLGTHAATGNSRETFVTK